LRIAHGASAIDAALKLIEQRSGRGERDQWDAELHAKQVRAGIERVLRERRRQAREPSSDVELLPASWR
jgi:hypothetical protein